jgi:hypothetical protein
VCGVVCCHSCVVHNVRILVMLNRVLVSLHSCVSCENANELYRVRSSYVCPLVLAVACESLLLFEVTKVRVVESCSISVVVCALVSLTMSLLPEAKCSVCVLMLLLLLTEFDCSVVVVEWI